MPTVDAGILLRFLPIVLQSLAPYVLPLCFMLSTVAVFGRLAADKEWIGIHMAGIHPLKTLLSPAIVAGLLGLLTFWMVSNELPQLKKRQLALLQLRELVGDHPEREQPEEPRDDGGREEGLQRVDPRHVDPDPLLVGREAAEDGHGAEHEAEGQHVRRQGLQHDR